MTPPGRKPLHGEDGFALIEVLVSALILSIVAAGVMALLQATTHSAAAERQHAEAYALAQEDQARLRSLRLSFLNRLTEKSEPPVKVGDDEFTIESQGVFVNNKNSQPSSCKSGETSADYVRITSIVSWNGSSNPVVLQSIVSPSNGSLDPSHGTLIVTTKNYLAEPVSGVGLSLSGAGSFSGTTDSTGCAYFTDLPAGEYTVTPSGAGLVDTNGNAPKAEKTTVVASGSATLPLVYDREAKIPVKFKYRTSTGAFESATGDSVFVFNSTMSPAKPYWTTGRTRQPELLVAPVFPYNSPVTIYPGVCSSNNPGTGAGQANISLTAGATYSPTLELQEPALEVTVKNGSSGAVKGAKVTITDEVCKDAEAHTVTREYTTEAAGHQSSSTTGRPEFGLPYSTYKVCASSGNKKKSESGVSVKSLTSSKTLTLDLSSGTSGSC